jgi:hypothetical protein
VGTLGTVPRYGEGKGGVATRRVENGTGVALRSKTGTRSPVEMRCAALWFSKLVEGRNSETSSRISYLENDYGVDYYM